MGLIRGGLVLILGILLFMTFLAMNTLATFSSSLSYDNVRDGIYPLLRGMTESSVIPVDILGNLNLTKVAEGEKQKILNYCRIQNISAYNFSYEGYAVDIPCEVAASGSEAIVNETISDVVKGVYYTEYNCNFWNCFLKDQFPFFLVSQKAHDYWKSKFYLSLLVSLILIALIVLFMENRINAPIIIGILLALSAISILKLSVLISAIVGQPISYIIEIFFSKANVIFWISFILGLVLIGAGFAAKVMNLGFIKKLIQKKPEDKVKEIVKEEIMEEKQKEQAKRASQQRAKKKKR